MTCAAPALLTSRTREAGHATRFALFCASSNLRRSAAASVAAASAAAPASASAAAAAEENGQAAPVNTSSLLAELARKLNAKNVKVSDIMKNHGIE